MSFKKWLCALSAAALCVTCVACGNSNDNGKPEIPDGKNAQLRAKRRKLPQKTRLNKENTKNGRKEI